MKDDEAGAAPEPPTDETAANEGVAHEDELDLDSLSKKKKKKKKQPVHLDDDNDEEVSAAAADAVADVDVPEIPGKKDTDQWLREFIMAMAESR